MKAHRSELAFHPLLAQQPTMLGARRWLEGIRVNGENNPKTRNDAKHRLEELDEEFLSRCGDLERHGIIEPLAVIAVPAGHVDAKAGKRWHILDGRHRYDLSPDSLDQLPIKVLPDDTDVKAFMLRALTQRNSYSKFQRAFLALDVFPELVRPGKAGRKPSKSIAEPFGNFSKEWLAGQAGCSKDTIEDAAEIHQMCLDDEEEAPRYRTQVQLGFSAADIRQTQRTGKIPGNGKHGTPSERMEKVWTHAGTQIHKLWSSWDEMDAKQRADVKGVIKENFLGQLPKGALEIIATLLPKAIKNVEGGS